MSTIFDLAVILFFLQGERGISYLYNYECTFDSVDKNELGEHGNAPEKGEDDDEKEHR